MKVTELNIVGVLLFDPAVHSDARGHFFEMFQARRYADHGLTGPWTQDNVSRSGKGTLRGLHFQYPSQPGKLVSVLRGRVFDVAVDIRRSSPTFGRWVGAELDDEGHAQLWVPPGFAHGFQVLSECADLDYKCSISFWSKADEGCIRFDDPAIGIDWPLAIGTLNERDASAPLLSDAPTLPT